MGNANIDDGLKKQILKLLKDKEDRAKYQNLKGFIDNACNESLSRLAVKPDKNKEILEGILRQSGLDPLNLMNSVYLVNKRDPIPKNLTISEKVDLSLQNLGFKEVRKRFNKDAYYGLLTDFAWHQGPSKDGAEFTPINYQINEVIKLFPEDEIKLRALKRRLICVIFLEKEIKYILERYDFERIPVLIDWLSNKFERYSTLVAELCLFVIEYYHEKTNTKINHKDIRFENLVDHIKDLDKLFQHINTTLEGYLIVTTRNEIVHSTGYYLTKNGDLIEIHVPEIDIKPEFGIMEDYVKDVYSLFFKGKKRYGEDIIVPDPRFPYISLRYTVTKKGSIDWPKTKLIVDLDVEKYLKIATGFTFLLNRTLLEKIITEKRNYNA